MKKTIIIVLIIAALAVAAFFLLRKNEPPKIEDPQIFIDQLLRLEGSHRDNLVIQRIPSAARIFNYISLKRMDIAKHIWDTETDESERAILRRFYGHVKGW